MRSFIIFLLFLTISVFTINYIHPGFIHDVLNDPTVKKILKITPCDKPIRYKIGTIDSRFNISQSVFQNDIDEASNIWAKIDNDKSMFVYDAQADLTINLIYDERQSLDNQITNLENNLGNNKTSIDQQISEYNNLSADFKNKLNDFNNQVAYWNSRGGAPPDVYQKLKEQQQSLQDEANRVNDLARKLNLQTENYNSQVNNLNETVYQYNSVIAQKPEEGIYSPKRNAIDIYFGSDRVELIHTLAHEMGHAMGIDHNSNKESIMYPYTTKSLTASADDIAEVKNICQF